MIEPPINRRIEDLAEPFRRIYARLASDLRTAGFWPWLDEGLRTVDRQAWIYAEGRTRQGSIRTQCDGIHKPSNHQARPPLAGGWAADTRFLLAEHGRVAPLPAWAIEYRTLGLFAERAGLRWGGRFGMKPKLWHLTPLEIPTNALGNDVGHVEMPPAA